MKSKKKRILLGVGIIISVLGATFGFYGYQMVYTPNILLDIPMADGSKIVKPDSVEVIIPEGTDFRELIQILQKDSIVHNMTSFGFLAGVMNYQENVKSGVYVLKKGWTNREAIKYLRSGQQNIAKVTFNNIQNTMDIKEVLAGKVCKNITADSATFLHMMHDTSFIKTLTEEGETPFDTTTITTLFLPDTYEFYQLSDEEKVFRRMKKEYDKYWNGERDSKAKKIGLSRFEVYILASIIQAETNKNEEKPRMAGVYIKRLRNGWPLGADPTVKYAVGDFTIKRVLNKHLEVDSPYNTYKKQGLPPTPINVPSKTSIDAVLNYEQNDYWYFCAKEDFSGYHSFAKTAAEHAKNARRYQKALNAIGL